MRVDGDVLRDAHRRGEHDHAPPHAGVDRQYIRPLGSGKIGTLSYSDPETGSHFWYPISSGAERSNGGFKVRKKASWTTSAGFADFYVVQTTSPDFTGYDDLSVFVIDGGDVESQPSLWDALGLRGNQSGPLEVPDVEVPGEQIVGPVGDGAASNDESVDPWFLIGSSSVWNGIALGTIDIAKRHTTRKRHVDVGMRVADYPTIQDYVGRGGHGHERLARSSSRSRTPWTARPTNNTKVLAPGEFARADFLHWAWQIKFIAAKNVAHVVDKMLHACGGSGYKRDMELERYLRDAKAGWVMGPTNEVLRQFVGKAVLLGFDSLDYWNQTYNRRAVENEVKKLDSAAKRELAEQLLARGRGARGEGTGPEGLRWRSGPQRSPGLAPPRGPVRRDVPRQAGRGDGFRPRGRRTRDGRRRASEARSPSSRPSTRRAATPRLRSVRRRTLRRRSSAKRSATATASLLAAELGARGLDPSEATARLALRRWSPPGSSQAFRAERPVTIVVAAPAGRIVDGAPPPSELLVEVRRATPRQYEQFELPPPLAEPRLDLRVDSATALAYEVRRR